MQHSSDGGVTWSAAATVHIPVTGVIPVVQPNGALTLVFWSQRASSMAAVRSTDGGVTLGDPVTITPIQAKPASPFRSPPIPAADADGAGRVTAVWQDCRFRADCQANDIVVSRSADGATWSPPVRVTRNVNAVMPTIGVRTPDGETCNRLLRPPAERRRRGARDVAGRLELERAAATECAANAAHLDAGHDARPDARRLHRRHMVARPPAGRLCARVAAANGKLRQAIYAARG